MQRSITYLILLLTILIAATAPSTRPLAAQNCMDEAELVEQSFDPPLAPAASAAADLGAPYAVVPDAEFMGSWTVQNSGDCTWSRAYRLIFVEGDRLDGARTVRLRSQVEPGQRVTLALDLIAPAAFGAYRGTWQLRNADGDNFGPELAVNIQVGDAASAPVATTDIVLPEVLVFGGMGGDDDPNALIYCLEDGALPTEPTLVVDREALVWRYTTLYVCGLPEGAEVTVEVLDPEGNTFSRSFVEDAPVTGVDDAGNEYFGGVLQIPLAWLRQSPTGEWEVRVSSDDYAEVTTFMLPALAENDLVENDLVEDGLEIPLLDNWPTAPIDPFTGAEGCHYAYSPGQAMMIGGSNLPPDTVLPLGIYQERFGQGYLIEQMTVPIDAAGNFTLTFNALAEPGNFNMVMLQEVVAEGFSNDGVEYDAGAGGQTAFGCFSVKLEEEPEFPLRLAFAAGELGLAEIQVFDLVAGVGYYPTFTAGQCDTSDPAWWPDEVWVLYQSNCLRTQTDDGWYEYSAGEDYDLYATLIDPTYLLAEDEKLVRLTETPDVHETEADANADGQIVYRETPLDDSLDASGELRVLDIFEETDVALGLVGRAPTWSPDGTRIAFMSDQGDVGAAGSWQIYVYDVEDDEFWWVSEDCPTHCRLPAWSPNNRQLIYHVAVSLEDFTPVGLWIASVTGISKPRLFLEGEYGRPTWSSEGWIAFQGPDGIYRATTDGPPTDGPPTVQRYLHSPEWGAFGSPDWSH